MKSSDIFAKRITELREEQGLGIRELSRVMNIPHSSILNYENSKRIPNIDVLQKYVEYFKVSADYLLGLTDMRS